MDSPFKTPIPGIYGIQNWGNGYFDVNAAGHLVVKPFRTGVGVDVFELVEELRRRRVNVPVLLRFPQILESQVRTLHTAFQSAISEFHYGAGYQGVFPMKVNHRRDVVEELLRIGYKYQLGLEVGSKSELYVGLSMEQSPESLLICNGFKDEGFIEMAFWAEALGKRVVVVIEQLREIHSYCRLAETTGRLPMIGLRGRLYSKGSGKWEESGGETSKFGLTTEELLECFRILQEKGFLDRLRMLHFHIGSQITDIRKIKTAVKEASRVYAKFRHMKAPVEFLNVGGGLGIDYDGSKTPSDSSANYTMQEFANDVVYTVSEICDNEDVPAPTLVSESGRALAVYHSLLVTNAANRTIPGLATRHESSLPGKSSAVTEMCEINRDISVKNFREYFHDALQQREELFSLFDLGFLSLEERALGESLFQEICERALRFSKQANYVSDEFEILEKALRKKYITNFSVFQSMPDFWTIGQLFPVLPIHRLNEYPTEYGILVDLTCDSDGQIDSFVDVKDIKEILELHPTSNGTPYYIAMCLLGAYQDVMGDFHNLFGMVAEAHVVVGENGRYHVQKLIPGSTVRDMVATAGFSPDDLAERFRSHLARAVQRGLLDDESAAALGQAYLARAGDSTYLDLG